jgi:hypothetical protein
VQHVQGGTVTLVHLERLDEKVLPVAIDIQDKLRGLVNDFEAWKE